MSFWKRLFGTCDTPAKPTAPPNSPPQKATPAPASPPPVSQVADVTPKPQSSPHPTRFTDHAIFKEDADGRYVILRRSFIDTIAEQTGSKVTNPKFAQFGVQDMVVSIALKLLGASDDEVKMYVKLPASGLVHAHQSARDVLKGELDASWCVPVYLVYFPHMSTLIQTLKSK